MSVLFSDRIQRLVVDKASGQQKKLAEKMDIPQGAISGYVTGKKDKTTGQHRIVEPGVEFVYKLKKAIPELNLDWFITGEGSPYIENTPNGVSEIQHQYASTGQPLKQLLRAHEELINLLKEKVSVSVEKPNNGSK